MKFMKQVGDGQMSLEDGAANDRLEQAWADEFKLDEDETPGPSLLEVAAHHKSDEWSKEFTEDAKEVSVQKLL